MYALVLVLDNPQRLEELIEAWEAAGIPGATVLESTGMHRVITRREPRASQAGFGKLVLAGYDTNLTLFTVVESLEDAERAAEAAMSVLGDLQGEHTGLMAAVPLAATWGLPKERLP